MFTLALWARGLRVLPRTIPGTSVALYTREMNRQTQHWTIVITGWRARETWTAGPVTISEATTRLWFRDETTWITERNAALYAVGWRLTSFRAVSHLPVSL